jgi:diguanylate cyclase (GGDEF)-like protein/PAS domain S-box-containing protein
MNYDNSNKGTPGFEPKLSTAAADQSPTRHVGPGLFDARELSHLETMFEQAPSFIAVVQGPDHVFILANRAYYRLVGFRNLIGLPARAALPEFVEHSYIELADQVYASGEPVVGRQREVTVQVGPGAPAVTRYVDFVFQPLVGQDGAVFGVFIEGHDVTDQKHALDALKISNERWMFAIEGTRDGVWDYDLESGEVFVTRRYKEILGYNEAQDSRLKETWEETLHPDDLPWVLEKFEDTLRTGAPYHVECRVQCLNGMYKWVLSRGVVVARDGAGRPLRVTGTLTDISEKKEVEATIWRHASVDPLTGLPNRRLFRDRLEHEMQRAQRDGSQLALLFLDLDRFKEVNDLRGHDAGDQLLAQVAGRLVASVRSCDTVARLGGDEFTVILTDLHDRSHVEHVAQKLIAQVASSFHLRDDIVHLSASIGITLFPTDGAQSEELIRNADQAMYAAKHAGRNQFRFFTRAMQDAAQTRIRMIQDLRRSFGTQDLQVLYQPVVDLQQGCITKAEALLRWSHPNDGQVSPANFIPLAEESGLIHEIGDWVFVEAARYSKRWSDLLARPFQVSVNCSPVQILAGEADKWPAVLREQNLPGPGITIEITEGVLLNASPRVAEVFAKYRDSGIQIALDDFGTGYSSLSYLTQFDIDYLKIDQSFVRGIATSEKSRAIVESIIAMAHRLGILVIAEGIETQEQANVLRAAGCDLGQGHLYSAAVPAATMDALLSRQAGTSS